MTTVFEIRGLMIRQTVSLVVLVVVFLWGIGEIVRASGGGGDSWAYLFGIAFIGGAIYGLRQLLTDSRDQIARLEVADDGRTIATLWRPTGTLKLEARNGLTGWRYYVKIGPRSIKRPYLFAEHPDHPNPLQFELRQDTVIHDGLRELAPEAVAEFEASRGSSKPAS